MAELETGSEYDFANILLAGACNARCPFCIGQQLDPALRPPNLDEFPPRNLERLLVLIHRHAIRQIVVTGTTTDPQLYRHEAALLSLLRRELPPGAQISLHTNGRLALRKLETFNRYDRVCISLPSFNPLTYRQMMGVPHPPALPLILRAARVPVKLSCVVNEFNRAEIGGYLRTCRELGVRRVVLRKLYGERRAWSALLDLPALRLDSAGEYRGNPVYRLDELEITLWDFLETGSRSLNLFSSGLISPEYRLTQAGSTPRPAEERLEKHPRLKALPAQQALRQERAGCQPQGGSD